MIAGEPGTVSGAPGVRDESTDVAENELIELLRELIRRESSNPGTYEEPLASWVGRWIVDNTAAAPRFIESLPGRRSVGAILGDGHRPRLILNGHLDTVPPGDLGRWTVPPFDASCVDGTIVGLGACDMKAGLAIMLDTARWLSTQLHRLHGALVLQFAVAEESAGPGTESLLEAGFTGDHAVVLEPTRLEVATATRGLAHIEIAITGRGGHASDPSNATSPLEPLSDVLLTVERLEATLVEHHLLGRGHLTPTVLTAGSKENVIPDQLRLVVDRRLVPGESVEFAVAQVDGALAATRGRHPKTTIEVRSLTPGFGPAEVDPESRFIALMLRAASAATGRAATPVAASFASDVSRLVSAGIEAVTFGPGDIRDCHRPNECVRVDEVVAGARAIRQLVRDVLFVPD